MQQYGRLVWFAGSDFWTTVGKHVKFDMLIDENVARKSVIYYSDGADFCGYVQ
jgi:hypothetical protein